MSHIKKTVEMNQILSNYELKSMQPNHRIIIASQVLGKIIRNKSKTDPFK